MAPSTDALGVLDTEEAPLADATDSNEAGNRHKNKPGRPSNIDHAQYTFIMTGYSAYSSLRLAKRPQEEISKCINKHTVRYIDFFGPGGAFRRGAKVLEDASDDEESIDMDEDSPVVKEKPSSGAGAAQSTMVCTVTAVVVDAETARHLRQDKLFKAVRQACFKLSRTRSYN